MYRIAIVEDLAIMREGLIAILNQEPEFRVVAQARNPIELFRSAWPAPPDLVLLNLMMSKMNGIEAMEEIKKRWRYAKILVYTYKDSETNISEAFQAGADGYLLKDTAPEELIKAIKKILAGHYYVSDVVLSKIMNRYRVAERILSMQQLQAILTTRERELLKLIIDGYKNREIANDLCISLKTVETHRTNLMKKLKVHNVAELISTAEEFGIFPHSEKPKYQPAMPELILMEDHT
jgi:DNA-binding NarL/FixJ family response regulator